MFSQCRQGICCGLSVGFLKEMLEAAQISGKKRNFQMHGIDFLIFPNGIIENKCGKRVKIVRSDGTIANIGED